MADDPVVPQQTEDPVAAYKRKYGGASATATADDPVAAYKAKYGPKPSGPVHVGTDGTVDLRDDTEAAPIRMAPVVVSKPAPMLQAPAVAPSDATRLRPEKNPQAKRLTGLPAKATEVFQSMADNPVSTATAIPLAPIKSAFTTGRYLGQQVSTDQSADADASRSLGIEPVTGKEGAIAAAQTAAMMAGPFINRGVTRVALAGAQKAGLVGDMATTGVVGGAGKLAPTVGSAVEGATIGATYDPEHPARGAAVGGVLGVAGDVLPRLRLRKAGAPIADAAHTLPRRGEPTASAHVVGEEPPPPASPDYEVETVDETLAKGQQETASAKPATRVRKQPVAAEAPSTVTPDARPVEAAPPVTAVAGVTRPEVPATAPVAPVAEQAPPITAVAGVTAPNAPAPSVGIPAQPPTAAPTPDSSPPAGTAPALRTVQLSKPLAALTLEERRTVRQKLVDERDRTRRLRDEAPPASSGVVNTQFREGFDQHLGALESDLATLKASASAPAIPDAAPLDAVEAYKQKYGGAAPAPASDGVGAPSASAQAEPPAAKGRALFTPDELAGFDAHDIDVSGVSAAYKAEALQQLAFRDKKAADLAAPDYNDKVRQEYARAADARPSDQERISRSLAHGHTHLDTVLAGESGPVIGRELRDVHDQSVTGTVTAQTPQGVTVEWSAGPKAGTSSMVPASDAKDYVALPVSQQQGKRLATQATRRAEQEAKQAEKAAAQAKADKAKAAAKKPVAKKLAKPTKPAATKAPAPKPEARPSADEAVPTHLDSPEMRAAITRAAEIEPTHTIDTPERHALRERGVQRMTEAPDGSAPRAEKIAVIVTGLPGSGKTSTIVDKFAAQYHAAVPDADRFKEMAPEYEHGLGAGALHPESIAVRAAAMKRLTAKGANLVFPTVGNPTETPQLARDLQAHGYTVHVAHSEVPHDVAARRAFDGYMKTVRGEPNGRHFVSPASILKRGDEPRRAYAALADTPGVIAHAPLDNTVPHGTTARPIADWRREWGLGRSDADEHPAASGGRPGRRAGAQPDAAGNRAHARRLARPTPDAQQAPAPSPVSPGRLDDGKVEDTDGVRRFADARSPSGGMRPVENVATRGLLTELIDLEQKRADAEARGIYELREDPNFHTSGIPQIVSTKGKNGGPSRQAKALQNLKGYAAITERVYAELATRMPADEVWHAVDDLKAEQDERAGAAGDYGVPSSRDVIRDASGKALFEPPARYAPERVTHAAVKLPSGRVVTGVNHEQALAGAIQRGEVSASWHPNYDYNDGWQTTHRPFVSREQGYAIAERQGQLRARNADRELTHDEFAGGGRPSRLGEPGADYDLFGNQVEPSEPAQSSLFGETAGTESARSLRETEAASRAELATLKQRMALLDGNAGRRLVDPKQTAERAKIASRIAELEKLVNRDKAISADELRTRAQGGLFEPRARYDASQPVTERPAFKQWFAESKVVDAEGNPLRVYHGTQRSDRFGPRILAKRATSGPMPFFTDDPAVASSYATNKSDTSLPEDERNYDHWFRAKVPGSRSAIPLPQTWWHLTPEQRATISALAPRVTTTDDGEHIIIGPESNTNGNGGYDLRDRDVRGNPLKALVEAWLNSAALYNDEWKFLDVLKHAGYPLQVEVHDPQAGSPGVTPAYLSIQNPLDTSDIPPEVVQALASRAKTVRHRGARGDGVDLWDKRYRSPKDWMAALTEDLANGKNSYAWTSIPDWVTETLQGLGYDGIKDTGGKMGGQAHSVYVPFEAGQIKSAIADNRTFNRASDNILKEKGDGYAPTPEQASLFDHPTSERALAADRENVTHAFGSPDAAGQAATDLVREAPAITTLRAKGLPVSPDRIASVKLADRRAWVDLRGTRIDSPDVAAQVLHAFRNPRMERLSVILMDDAKTVLSHSMVTSGALGAVQFGDDFVPRAIARAKRLGATRAIISHNHPSGDPTPSADDHAFTARVGAAFEQAGITLDGHLVTDHTTASWITPKRTDAGWSLTRQGVSVPGGSGPDWTDATGARVTNPGAVARLVVDSVSPDSFHAIYLNSQNQVVAIEPHGAAALPSMEQWLAQRIKANAASTVIFGAPNDVAAQVARQLIYYGHRAAWASRVLDVVGVDPERPSVYRSYAEMGHLDSLPIRFRVPDARSVFEEGAKYDVTGRDDHAAEGRDDDQARAPLSGAAAGTVPESDRGPASAGEAGRVPENERVADSPAPESFGVKNAKNAETRDQFALGDRPAHEPRTQAEMYEAGKAAAEADPTAIPTLLQALRDDPEKIVGTATEAGLLLKYRVDLEHKLTTLLAAKGLAVETEDPAAEQMARLQLAAHREAMHEFVTLAERTGTATARALAARRMMSALDYSLSGMESAAESAKGASLTEQELARVRALHAELQEKLAAAEQDATDARERAATAEAELHHAQMRLEIAGPLADRLAARLDKAAEDAMARIRRRGLRAMAGMDPVDLADHAIVGAAAIARGARAFAAWSDTMLTTFGEGIAPHLEEVFDASRARLDTEIEGMRGGVPKPAAPKTGTSPESIRAKMRHRVDEDGLTVADLRPYLRQLALAHIRSGVTGRDAVLDRLHADVKAILPDVSRSAVRDALSGYGDFKPLDKAADKKRLREIAAESQKLAQLEALQKGEAPLATGFERPAPNDETRRLTKQVNEAKKAAGIGGVDDATRLKSALAATKTRLRNTINDLQTEIDTGERIVKSKHVALEDAEVRALKTQLAELRRAETESFGVRGMNPEQQLKAAISAAKRNALLWHDRLLAARKGEFGQSHVARQLGDPQLDALRAQAAAAREEYHALETLAPREIHPLRTPRPKPVVHGTEGIEHAPDEPLIGVGTAAEENPADDLTATSAPGIKKGATDEHPDVIAARREMQANAQYRARLARQEAEIRARMATEDYAPRLPKPRRVYDAETMRRKAEVERVKAEFQEAVHQYELAHRSRLEKVRDVGLSFIRAGALSWPSVLLKLSSVALSRIVTTPLTDLVGVGVAKALPRLAKGAPRHGTRSATVALKAEVAAQVSMWTDGLRDAGQLLRNRQSSLTLVHGKHKAPHKWYEYFGSLHAAMKEPVKRAEYARSLYRRTVDASERGENVADEVVRLRLSTEAYKDAERAVAMNDNPIVTAWNGLLRSLEAKDKVTGKRSAVYSLLATALRADMPIVKAPTNVLIDASEYIHGILSGPAKAAWEYAHGIEDLAPVERDSIIRLISKGLVGAAIMALYFYKHDKIEFGGFYRAGEHRAPEDVPAGGAKFYGRVIDKKYLHNPLFMAGQFAASIARVAPTKLRKHDKDPVGYWSALGAASVGLFEEMPIINSVAKDAQSLADDKTRPEFLSKKMAAIAVPGVVQWMASAMDTSTVARKPVGLKQHLQANIPGLRNEVPTISPREERKHLKQGRLALRQMQKPQ